MGTGCGSASRRAVERAAFLVVESLEQRRFLSAAALDTNYGSGGVAQSDFQGSTFDTSADAVQFQGDVLTAGNASGRATLVAYTAGDVRDPNFGANGAVAIPTDVLSEAARLQIDGSGRILVAGSLNGVAAVARFNPDGTVDGSFGSGGVATQSAIGTNVTAVQTDSAGDVIISGDGSVSGNSDSSFALARFTEGGAVDTTFNGSGFVVDDRGTTHRSSISDIAMDGDEILALGNVDEGQFPANVQLSRYNPDGSLDATFGALATPGTLGFDDLGLGVRVAVSQDKIIIGGQGGLNDLTVVRLSDTGQLDATFGNNINAPGYSTAPGVEEAPSDMKVDTDGSILLTGSAGDNFNAVRVSNAGFPGALVTEQVGSYEADAAAVVIGGTSATIYGTEFTNAGEANFALVSLSEPGDSAAPFVTDSFSLSQATATTMAAQPDGSVIVIGTAVSEISTDIVASKYLPDGSPDTSFGSEGEATIIDLGDLSLVGVNTLGFNGTVNSTSDGAGGAYLLLQNGLGTGNSVAVLHIASDGTLDQSFDANAVYSDPSATLTPAAILRGHDGSIYVSGERSLVDQDMNQEISGFILKLGTDGTPNATFGGSGIVLADFDVESTGGFSAVTALTSAADGSIVGAGFLESSDGASIQPAAIHVSTDGSPLPIGTNAAGVAVAASGTPMLLAMGVAVDATGGILLGGPSLDTGSAAAERFDANGVVDSTYGIGGVTSLSDGSQFAGMTVQSGEVVLATATTDGGAEVVRFTTAGQLDANFDDDGIAPVNTGDPLSPVGIALAPSDRILVAGTMDSEFTVAALLHSDAQPTVTVTQQADPLHAGQNMLVIQGTPGNDVIELDYSQQKVNKVQVQTITVLSNNVVIFTTTNPFSRIQVFANSGDDSVTHGGGFKRALELYGGDGNDTLKAGSNGDILVGGAGNDSLVSGAGNDVEIGGTGADKIVGDAGDDLLIAGSTSYDNDPASLDAISAEWTSADDFNTRVADLTNGGGQNGNVKLVADVTVFDDDVKDTLNSGTGSDWMFYNTSDGKGFADKNNGLDTVSGDLGTLI